MKQLFKHTPVIVRQSIAIMLSLTVFISALTAGISGLVNRVKIIDSSLMQVIYTLTSSPSRILAYAGIKLDSDDTYSMNWITPREGEIILKRALDATVIYGDKVVNVCLPDATVGDAVKKAGIKLTDDMVLNCSVNDKITDGMAIEIYDIITTTVTEDVAIPYETIVTKSSSVENGTVKCTVKGKDGLKRITYNQVEINGEIVSKTVVNEEIITEPVTCKTVVGTKTAAKPKNTSKPSQSTVSSSSSSSSSSTASSASSESSSSASSTEQKPSGDGSTVYYTSAGYKYISTLKPSNDFELDENGVPVHYKKLITGKATAYTYTGNRTATGKKTRPGYIAVNPKQIPYGTKMFIRSSDGKYIYGYASAEDTGGFAKGKRIIADLFFTTEKACNKFGVRNIEIYILG